jgi:hypothetical protein
MPTDSEIAWFAGVFEGEGTFETSKRSTVRMTIAMSDRDIIERIDRIYPSGNNIAVRDDEAARSRFANPKTMYVWRIGQAEMVAAVIGEILPWLGERRASRARQVLEHIDRKQRPGEPRASHCKAGHALTPDNLVKRGGKSPYLRCKSCAREQERAYRERKRAPALD